MCLGIANAAGVRRISYVNTREMAGDIKFSDKLQYDLLSQEDLLKQMTHAESLIPREKDALQKKLGTHGAMVLDADGNVFSYGDDDTEVDPTRVASIQAVREACRLADSFDLPDGYSLVTQKIPHMSGLITADWARILRDRNPNHMDDPSYDSKSISSGKIIYMKPEYEQVVLRNGQGETRIAQKTEETYKQPGLRDQERAVQTEKYRDTGLASRSRFLDREKWEKGGGEETLNPKKLDDTTIAAGASARVFEAWMNGITNGFQKMY
jgi:tRNA(Arg) A34 adenosine deaminase TadA